MQEAVEFVRIKGQSVADKLTQEQSKITKQFLRFKRRNLGKIDTLDEYKNKMEVSEAAHALNCPINESSHGLDASLKLYDCLVPAMRMHNKSYGRSQDITANDILLKYKMQLQAWNANCVSNYN